jgi:hypothetical protein
MSVDKVIESRDTTMLNLRKNLDFFHDKLFVVTFVVDFYCDYMFSRLVTSFMNWAKLADTEVAQNLVVVYLRQVSYLLWPWTHYTEWGLRPNLRWSRRYMNLLWLNWPWCNPCSCGTNRSTNSFTRWVWLISTELLLELSLLKWLGVVIFSEFRLVWFVCKVSVHF